MSEKGEQPAFAWVDGEFVAWPDAKIHVDTHGVQGGLNAYEVIAGFTVKDRSEVHLLRAADHMRRLSQTAKVMRIPPRRLSDDQMVDVVCELVARNEFHIDVLVRIVQYLGAGPLFSYKPEDITSGLFMVAKPANPDPPYSRGIHVATSHWSRLPDTAAPPRVKSGSNYQNARQAQIQAQVDGYDDAILLNGSGKVCELPLANVFIVRGDRLITPTITSGILEGITRDAILTFAKELGITCEEREVDRTELYIAAEGFATGTGREVWPILSVDRLQLGDGQVGPVTRRLQECLHLVMRNQAGHQEWLTPAYGRASHLTR